MPAEVKVPAFPESVEEGTLTAWHKQEGDTVAQDEKVADIETDKIVLEVSAPEAGVLSGIEVKEGQSVKPGTVLARIEAGSGKSEKSGSKKDGSESKQKEAEPEGEEAGDRDDAAKRASDKSDEGDEGDEEDAKGEDASEKKDAARLSPAVRRMVEEHDLDPSQIEGTGRGGVITKADVLKYLEEREGAESEEKEEPPKKVPEKKSASEPAPAEEKRSAGEAMTDAEGRPQKRVPMTRIRARIAERLVQAQQTAAILTTFNEVNMQPIMALRKRYKEQFEKSNGVKLGFMSFFVKAAVDALKRFPVVNATLDGQDIIYHGYYDIGVAVSTERGLVVPILRDADQQSYADIEKNITDFASRARDGKLGMADLTGGTFSITNGGIFGSLLSTPILNPPQSAILGMHQIQERPVAEDGNVVIRPIMYLALSYDHRLIDGREAVQFLVTIKENLEDPARVLLNL